MSKRGNYKVELTDAGRAMAALLQIKNVIEPYGTRAPFSILDEVRRIVERATDA